MVVIVAAAIGSISSCCSSADGSGPDAYRYSTGYGSTTVTATIGPATINASTMNATVISANATDTSASSICEGVS